MKKNRYTKNYNITIVGGGLAGKLMLAVLINSGVFDKNKLCWINTDDENFKDVRVSFINYKNFLQLKKNIRFDVCSKDYSIIDKIELHNTNEKYPLKLKDLNNHGIIIRNDISHVLNFRECHFISDFQDGLFGKNKPPECTPPTSTEI